MGLAETIDWDAARTISRRKTTRNLRESGESFYNLNEVIEEIVLEFNAANEAACNAEIDANEQPTSEDYDVQSYSYEMSEDDRTTGSYTIRRNFTGKTITFDTGA
jgi:hypothetical protein